MASGKLKTFLFCLFFAAIVQGPSVANAAVITFQNNRVTPPVLLRPYRLEPQGAAFNVLVPGFDPSLGTLQSIDIDYIILGARVGWGILNTPGNPYQARISLNATVSLPNGTQILSATDTKTVSGSTGNFGFQTFFDLFDTATLTDPVALSLFTGPGSIPLSFAGAFSFVSLSGNATSQGGGLSTGSLGLLNVAYTFGPAGGGVALPLPSSLLLFTSGLLLLGVMGGRQKAK